MRLIRVVRWLLLLAVSLLLAAPPVSAQDANFFKPGAVWKLKAGSPKPDQNLEWHHKNNRNRIGAGKVTFVTQDGIVMQWSYTEPPAQLVVGQSYRLSIQGVSTTHPGPPHKIAHVGIGADVKVMTSPLDGQGIYRNRNMSHGVIPPPLRPDYGNNPAADSIDFVFQPDSFNKSFRVWTHLPADGLPSLIYEYEPHTPAGGAGVPAGAGGAPAPPTLDSSRTTVVRSFQNALPPVGGPMIAWSTHVTIRWSTPSGEVSVNKGLFWQPSVKPGVLPALPLGQITFLDQGRLDQVIQFPATSLISIEADALIKWRGEGPTQLPPIPRPELTYRDVDRGFYAASGTSTQVHPALFFLPVPPTAVELSGSGVNMFGTGGAIIPDQVPTFRVNRLAARAGNADPMPENVFTTAHTASILTDPAAWPTIAEPDRSGWHQLFASQGPQHKPPRLVSSIRVLFGARAGGPTAGSGAGPGGTPSPPRAVRVPLNLYYSEARGDNFTTGTDVGEQSAKSAGYGFARIEAYGLRDPQLGTVPLKLYWNAARQDNFTTASAQGEQTALASGYVFVRVEAYIYPSQQPGTVPLKNYWSPARGDNFSTATAISEQSARDAGYAFAWIEGYVFPAGASLSLPGAGGYLGCFNDTGDRDLSAASVSNGTMSTEQCTAFCRGKGFSFAGTQYASFCFCDNKYGKFGNANRCDMKCAGNPSQICGGSWANSVYSTGVSPPATAYSLGKRWEVLENGLAGTWTRQGNSSTFDARWGGITAVLTIRVSGNQVSVTRRQSSDSNDCDYVGVLASDGRTVTGTYDCRSGRGYTWRATIN